MSVILIKDIEIERLSNEPPFIRVPHLNLPTACFYSSDTPISEMPNYTVEECHVHRLAKAHFNPVTHERRVREWRIAWTQEVVDRVPELREPILEMVHGNETLTYALHKTQKHNQRISERLNKLETGSVWQRVKVALFGQWMRELT